MLEISERLFSKWNKHNIPYCSWKSNEHLEEGLSGLTDLDILVSSDSKISCEAILQMLKFIKCKPQFGSCYPGVDDWLGYDTNTGKMIHIHLHYQIITGHRGMKEYNLPWSQEALDNRILDESTGIYIMEPNLEIITLYSRIALKASLKEICAAMKGTFKLERGYLKEIAYLKQRISLRTLGDLLKKYYDNENLLGDLIDQEVLTSRDFLSLHRYMTKSMKPYRRMNALFSFVQKIYYKTVLHIRVVVRKTANCLIICKKTPQNGGVTVAFIGQDGSGKSTVTDEILKWLTWKLDAYKFYLGSGEHYHSWQKNLKRKIEYKKRYKLIAIVSAFLTLSNHMAVAKRIYKFVKQGKRYAQNGGIVIFDRYPQTTHSGINDGPKIRFNYADKIGNPLLKRFVLFCAKVEEKYLAKAERVAPGIVFKLILPPEISLMRKPEENIENVKIKHEIIKSLSFGQSKVYTIDANSQYAEEIKEVKRLIWNNLLEQELSNSMD